MQQQKSESQGSERKVLCSLLSVSAGFIYVLVTWGLSLQSQGVDPEQFSSQDSSLMLGAEDPVFPQQYASQAQVAQGKDAHAGSKLPHHGTAAQLRPPSACSPGLGLRLHGPCAASPTS